jgi:hypothetical protein
MCVPGERAQVIRLYASGGSQEIDLGDRALRPDIWERTRGGAVRLLEGRGEVEAAELLRSIPFELWDGRNGFGDEFSVLYAGLPPDDYIRVADMQADPRAQAQFREIARALGDVDHGVRFITVSCDEAAEPQAVPAPTLATLSDHLDRALADVERSIRDGQPANCVDRIHTALHVYLAEVVRAAGLEVRNEPSITDLFRVLRQHHPKLQPAGPRAEDVTRIVMSMATVVDALNPIRNRASLAHPAELLADPEAMLVVNACRTLLHYLESRLR